MPIDLTKTGPGDFIVTMASSQDHPSCSFTSHGGESSSWEGTIPTGLEHFVD